MPRRCGRFLFYSILFARCRRKSSEHEPTEGALTRRAAPRKTSWMLLVSRTLIFLFLFFFSFHDPFNPLKLISIHGHTMNTMASILLLSKIKIFRATSLRFRRCPRSLLPRVPFCHKHDVITTRDLRAVPTSFSSPRTTHSLLKISIERMFPRHRVITSISILL